MIYWQNRLYNYGFLVTDDPDIPSVDIGVDWNAWRNTEIGAWKVWLHPLQKCYVFEDAFRSFLLIGHAYNPFTMEKDEPEILSHLSELFQDQGSFRDYFDQLTGLFFFAVIEKDRILCTSDCSGMLGAYYAKISGRLYFSSHCQLIADLCGLREDPYVTHLKSSRLFHLYGWYLPGDRSSYREIRRIIPNTEIRYDGSFHIERFYPRKKYRICEGEDYRDTVRKAEEILHNSMQLIAEKWEKPAISLTGGTDSKTTLACAADLQQRFRYYSYISIPREADDAKAAADVCRALELEHEIYSIPEDKAGFADFDEVDRLIERHYAYLGKGNPNDVRKRIVLAEEFKYDVEVKSWVSEIARASRYGIYRKKTMPARMTPRRMTTMYKVFVLDRVAAVQTDRVFADYIRETGLRQAVEDNEYPWTEFFVWEIVFGGWGSLALVGEHMLSNDITVPYNNRALLDLMLRTPLEKRRTDQLHRDIMDTGDPRLNQLGIHVVNSNSTKLRAYGERAYFEIHSRIPF